MMTEEVAEPTTVDVETDNNDAIDDEVLASSIVPSPTTTNDPTIVKPKRKWTTWCSLHDMDDDCLRVWSFIPRIFATISFALSLTVLLDCRFVYLDLGHYENGTASVTTETLRFGLYWYENIVTSGTDNNITITTDGTCVRYPDWLEISASFKAARAFAILTVILGGWMACIMWFKYCCRFLCLCCSDHLVIFNFVLLLPLFQGLAMMFYRDVCSLKLSEPPLSNVLIVDDPYYPEGHEIDCGLGAKGLYYPFSIALWILSGLLFWWIKPRTSDDFSFFTFSG